jgi:hypothetical protein
MPGGKDRYIECRREATYNVYNAAATPADIVYPLIIGDDAYMADPVSQVATVRSADSGNRPIFEIRSRKVVDWSIRTMGFADGTPPDDFMAWWLAMSTDISTGQLPSFTITEFDGVRNSRVFGCVVGTHEGTLAAETQEGALQLTLSGMASRVDRSGITFTRPASSVYPRNPYKHIESKGGVIFRTGGTAVRSIYRSLTYRIQNILARNFDEDAWASDITYEGRDVSASIVARLLTDADRDAFEAGTEYTASFLFTKPIPSHTLSLDFKNRNTITTLPRTFPLNARSYETLNFRPMVNSSGVDFSYATAAP